MLRRTGLNQSHLCTVYCSLVKPTLEYACPVWHTSLPNYLADVIQSVQKRALAIIFPELSYAKSLTKSGLNSLSTRRDNLCKLFFRKLTINNDKLTKECTDNSPIDSFNNQTKTFEP